MLQYIQTVDHLVAVNVIEHIKFERNHHEQSCGVPHAFSCKYQSCDFTYADPKYYNEHSSTKHSTEKRGIFQCPYCPATFKYCNGRTLHLQKH